MANRVPINEELISSVSGGTIYADWNADTSTGYVYSDVYGGKYIFHRDTALDVIKYIRDTEMGLSDQARIEQLVADQKITKIEE